MTSGAQQPRCWICGDPATTGEHKAKKTDLKAVFGSVSQQNPLFLNDGQRKNLRIGSFDSRQVKWGDVLCAPCNNHRTQAHDRAWEEFSHQLLADANLLVPGATVMLANIFGQDHERIMTGVHHYLTKAFGCLAAQEAAFSSKIDMAGLGEAITSGQPYPGLFIDLGVPSRASKGAIVAASNPELILDPQDGSCGLATWFYNVNGVCALVAYAPNMAFWAQRQGLWHPSFQMDRLIVKDFQDRERPD